MYEDRVMTRLVNMRSAIELLQHRLMTSGIDKLTLLGELESLRTQVSRALLEPVDPTGETPPSLSLVSRKQTTDEEST